MVSSILEVGACLDWTSLRRSLLLGTFLFWPCPPAAAERGPQQPMLESGAQRSLRLRQRQTNNALLIEELFQHCQLLYNTY